jgi:glycosyltransferase involved in cell wall biosynthesis
MATPIGSILRQISRNNKDKFRCLTFPTHERYSSNLFAVNCDFYMIPYINDQITPGVKKNGWIESYARMPKNHIMLPRKENLLEVIPNWLDFDFILGQHKFGQAQIALQLGQYFNIPVTLVDHTMPTDDNLRAAVPQLKQIRGDINIFISEFSRNEWGWSEDEAEVIVHGVNTDLFKPSNVTKQKHVLAINNDWRNRGDILGFDIFERVVLKNNYPFRVIGDNPGLSAPAKNVYELVKAYNEATVFVNTSRYSPIPSVILEAMSVGLPVVSTDNCLISDIIIDDVNGFKTNDESLMAQRISMLLSSEKECKRLGEAARQTILERFPLNRFTERWNEVFEKAGAIRK